MRILIIGFGVGGATAAETARKKAPDAEITVFSKEEELFYFRMRLPEVLSGAVSAGGIIAHPAEWYEERRIELLLGEPAEEIDPAAGIVRGKNGTLRRYDRLLLAVGAEASRLDVPGSDLRGVFAVRGLSDVLALKAYAAGSRQAVLVGGGLLGLEVAHALTRLGVGVTVLEISDRVLPLQTTPDSARLLQKKLANLGIHFMLQAQMKSFSGRGKLEKVHLADGREIKADIAVFSVGVKPDLSLAKQMGLALDKAVLVDEWMETSLPGVFAAGDCAQFGSRPGGLWTVARQQALAAGANLAANSQEQREKFVPAPRSSVLKVAGIDCISAGNIDPAGRMAYAEAATGEVYRKVVLDSEGRIAGFTILGTAEGGRQLNAALASGKVLSPRLLAALNSLDFDFSSLS